MFQPWHFTWTSDKQRLRGSKLLKNVAHVRPIVSKQFGGGQGTGSGVKELCRHIPNSPDRLAQAASSGIRIHIHFQPRPHRHHHRAHHEAHQHQLVCPYIAQRATKFHAITTTHTQSPSSFFNPPSLFCVLATA